MGEARAVVVGRAVYKNLGLIFQPSEAAAVQYPIAIARKTRPQRVWWFGMFSA
jgi:hypothetical protein